MIPRLRASPRHGGAGSQSLNRRGGVPSGAATFIIYGGMGVSTPIIMSERHDFHGKSCFILQFGFILLVIMRETPSLPKEGVILQTADKRKRITGKLDFDRALFLFLVLITKNFQ